MGKDTYLVAYTSDTLLLGDLRSNKLSEVGREITRIRFQNFSCRAFACDVTAAMLVYQKKRIFNIFFRKATKICKIFP